MHFRAYFYTLLNFSPKQDGLLDETNSQPNEELDENNPECPENGPKCPKTSTVEKSNISKPVPGTTLKCLEDPSFEFDTNLHKSLSNDSCSNQPPPAKKPAYRVLEGMPNINIYYVFISTQTLIISLKAMQ